MSAKTYRIHHIWPGFRGKLKFAQVMMIWDQDDPQSIPQMILEEGDLRSIQASRLLRLQDEGADFVYVDPSLDAP